MMGMRSGLGQKSGPVMPDPGSMGALKTGQRKRRKSPKNIKGLVKKRTKKKLNLK